MSMIDESESKYPTREMWAVKGPDGLTPERARAALAKLWREMADFRCAGSEMTADAVHMYMRDYAEQLREIAARLSGMAAAVPDGWKLVPCLPTLEMQKAYFESIDKHMHRVETDLLFGRFDNQRIAYTKMLDAAPEVPGHGCEQCDDHDFDGDGEEGARG